MRLPFIGKSVASRYEEAAASLGPSGAAEYADPITWAALRLAHEEIRHEYLPRIAFVGDVSAAQHLWANEAFRLANDGYVLGRIEVGTEGKVLSFSGLAVSDPLYEAGEFALVSAQAIAAGTLHGRFSGPPPPDISKLLKQFAMDAGEVVVEELADTSENYRLMGEAAGRTVNLGREIALVEDFYVNPKKRKELLAIREQLQGEALEYAEQVRRALRVVALDTPEDWARQFVRRVYDRIKL